MPARIQHTGIYYADIIGIINLYGCCYGIHLRGTDRWYIGQTTWELAKYLHDTYIVNYGKNRTHIGRALMLYGIEAFDFIPLGYAMNKEELDAMEIRFIKEYDSIENGFNLKEGGSHGKHTPETRAKISEETKKAMDAMTEEEKALMRKNQIDNTLRGEDHPQYNKPLKPETCQKLSAALSGENNPQFGIPRTEEYKQMMSIIQKEIYDALPEEEKQRRRNNSINYWANISPEEKSIILQPLITSNIGRVHSEEENEALRQRMLGENNPMFNKTHTEEVKKVISEAAIEAWKSFTSDEKEVINKKKSETMLNKTTEEKAEANRKRAEKRTSKTPEELAEINKKKSEAYYRMTDEEKAEKKRKEKETNDKKTPEEKAEITRKQQETKARNKAIKLLEQQKNLQEKPYGDFTELVEE